ncbi:MAG: polymerase large subunit [Thermoproteota archaeon]|nr:polymerase large subunit [Thermoproteota archaeon]
MQLATTNDCEQYLTNIEERLNSLYDIARKARKKGIDPSFEPEPHVVKDLAEMVEGLVGPPKVAERVRELSKKMDKYEMSFVVAEDIVHAKYGHTDAERAADQAVRTALAIMTGGITAAPIQGIAYVKVKQNFDKTRYLAVYFAGPIRSAGGTEQALTLVVGDFVRSRLGLDRYKPTNDEIQRFIEEVRLYEREVGRFQYHVSDQELEAALRSVPVEVTGTESDPIEVSSFRNLPRIETNRVRAGALRVVNDGIVGRSQKVLKIIETIGIEGWDWLKRMKDIQNGGTGNESSQAGYMEEAIAGRPIFSFPSRSSGFRLRYGRSRNTGLASMGIHPATMSVLQDFLATGTQMRIEKPGKGCIVVPVDTIEPPVVKLNDGSVVRVESYSEGKKLSNDIHEILFLGDLLVAFGEFLENNKPLSPSGYTEEWWAKEVQAKIQNDFQGSLGKAAETIPISSSLLEELLTSPLVSKPTAQEAIIISKSLGIPLHPHFTYFWKEIEIEDLSTLRHALRESDRKIEKGILTGLELPLNLKIKAILEKLCVSHRVYDKRIIIEQNDALILSTLLRIDNQEERVKKQKTVIETLKELSGITLREKGLTYIGARMGRPEKAKKRDMSPPVHALFPIGLAGGSRRNIVEAAGKKLIQVEITKRKCPECEEEFYQLICPNCGVETHQEKVCPRCARVIDGEVCPVCKSQTVGFEERIINIREIYEKASRSLGVQSLGLVKGVKGLTSALKTPEALEKGILRAKHDLSVFKDGTIRFDATNAPLTHFRPSEVDAPLDILRSLGYTHDTCGQPLQNPGQMFELKVQDVIIPKSCAEYLVRESKFIDELLQKVYKLPPCYNVQTEQDLIGQLIIGFAPHTSAGVVGRVLGFTSTNVCYAHPLWHNVKRRDCDGDEDSIMLVLDVLLNFSKAYLPSQIGGMMDAPLLLISVVNPFEVDEAQNLDVASSYPIAFYEKTLEHADSKVVGKIIDVVEHRLGTPAQFEGYSFTQMTNDINEGNLESSYIKLGTMTNKLMGQLGLAEKLRAVDSREVAKKVLTTHFIRDMAGNLKAFTGQKFRCKKCNTKYRRIPLSGKCSRCGGGILLTVHQKGIEKYLDIAEELTKKYDIGVYYQQRIALVRDEINSLFKEEKNNVKQIKLGEFM